MSADPLALPRVAVLRALFGRLALATVLTVPGCGGDDGTTPMEPVDPGPLAPFVGTWDGESVIHTQQADTTVTFDLIANGGSLEVEILATGRYVATVTFLGQESTESGLIRVDGAELVLTAQSPQPEPEARVRYMLTGNRMSWEGESRFDFNSDGTAEDSLLHADFIKIG